ncbi:hypothetical protein [Chitinibacter tainanensis]|uniref:hypothetical protein n=1 Tax=Chitinibacter tainanensis TaxID=230667 RepID=UPI0004255E0C|nr:hypothetical protein [Chitinibacter tainanensis]
MKFDTLKYGTYVLPHDPAKSREVMFRLKIVDLMESSPDKTLEAADQDYAREIANEYEGMSVLIGDDLIVSACKGQIMAVRKAYAVVH